MLLLNSAPVTLTKCSFGAEPIDFGGASLHAVAQDRRNTPFTPPAHACYALAEQARGSSGHAWDRACRGTGGFLCDVASYLSKTLSRIPTMVDVTPADMNRLLKCCAQRV